MDIFHGAEIFNENFPCVTCFVLLRNEGFFRLHLFLPAMSQFSFIKSPAEEMRNQVGNIRQQENAFFSRTETTQFPASNHPFQFLSQTPMTASDKETLKQMISKSDTLLITHPFITGDFFRIRSLHLRQSTFSSWKLSITPFTTIQFPRTKSPVGDVFEPNALDQAFEEMCITPSWEECSPGIYVCLCNRINNTFRVA